MTFSERQNWTRRDLPTPPLILYKRKHRKSNLDRVPQPGRGRQNVVLTARPRLEWRIVTAGPDVLHGCKSSYWGLTLRWQSSPPSPSQTGSRLRHWEYQGGGGEDGSLVAGFPPRVGEGCLWKEGRWLQGIPREIYSCQQCPQALSTGSRPNCCLWPPVGPIALLKTSLHH